MSDFLFFYLIISLAIIALGHTLYKLWLLYPENPLKNKKGFTFIDTLLSVTALGITTVIISGMATATEKIQDSTITQSAVLPIVNSLVADIQDTDYNSIISTTKDLKNGYTANITVTESMTNYKDIGIAILKNGSVVHSTLTSKIKFISGTGTTAEQNVPIQKIVGTEFAGYFLPNWTWVANPNPSTNLLNPQNTIPWLSTSCSSPSQTTPLHFYLQDAQISKINFKTYYPTTVKIEYFEIGTGAKPLIPFTNYPANQDVSLSLNKNTNEIWMTFTNLTYYASSKQYHASLQNIVLITGTNTTPKVYEL